jgi:preprotein translocase subunit SecG
LKVSGTSVTGALLSVILIILFTIMFTVSFPLYYFRSVTDASRWIDPSLIYREVSNALWNLRVLDVIIIATIFLFSAVACIVMLRKEGDAE